MMSIHGLIKPKYILGLSATPFRDDKLKLCFDKVIRDAGIHRLIQDGYLSEFHHYTLPNFSPSDVAETYLQDPKRWGKAIMYFHTVKDCQVAFEKLKSADIRVDLVTGSTHRESQLEAFATGKLDVLVNAQVLVEGLDEPTSETVFVRPSGCSTTVQMAGLFFANSIRSPSNKWCSARTHVGQ